MVKIRVLLADDHSLFREGLCGILNTLPDFEVVGEANDGLGNRGRDGQEKKTRKFLHI